MSILSLLRKHSLTLKIERVGIESTRRPGVILGHLRVELRDDSVQPPQVHQHLIDGAFASDSIEVLVAQTLREVMPEHPVFREWLNSRGNVPVELSDDSIENCGEALHTALRKLCGSPESTVQWNAIHHLHPDDWSSLLARTRRELTALKCKSADGRLLRRDVGALLQETWTEYSEDLFVSARQPDLGRTELQKFALLALNASCRGTEQQEFVWGWTGYLCSDASSDKSAEEVAVADESAKG